ncbi:hypothetical protein R3P38DRAFT_2565509, partial [Favolaschia claudopus]
LWDVPANEWLSQANYIFHQLNIFSNLRDYALLDGIEFCCQLSPCADVENHPPMGFLFLCPPQYFQTGMACFKWPEYSAYWSLDPWGVERLSIEQAFNIGFPIIQFSTTIRLRSWDDSAYAGLREFHRAKGFDPDTQDIAVHLNQPLYQISDNESEIAAEKGK